MTDPSTEAGRQFYQSFEDLLDQLGLHYFDEVQLCEERVGYEKKVQGERYKVYWERYQAAKKNKHPREWYALCSKARNLRELARFVGKEREYIFLYQFPSEVVHATDVISGVFEIGPGQGEWSMSQVRGPSGRIGHIAGLVTPCLIDMHERMLNTYFVTDRKIRKMYKRWHLSFGRYYLWGMKEHMEELTITARALSMKRRKGDRHNKSGFPLM